MKIAIGSDHGGFDLKNILIDHLKKNNYTVLDYGCYTTDSVDYPIYGEAVGNAVIEKKAEFGVLICGTGIGISIAANKIKGIRAALCTSTNMAEMTRRHNNANILCLGGRTTDATLALDILDVFLATAFEGDRHQRRLDMITDLENKTL